MARKTAQSAYDVTSICLSSVLLWLSPTRSYEPEIVKPGPFMIPRLAEPVTRFFVRLSMVLISTVSLFVRSRTHADSRMTWMLSGSL